jgi:hypothetical protein
VTARQQVEREASLRAKADQSTVIAAELRARAEREDRWAEFYLAQIAEIGSDAQ